MKGVAFFENHYLKHSTELQITNWINRNLDLRNYKEKNDNILIGFIKARISIAQEQQFFFCYERMKSILFRLDSAAFDKNVWNL